MKSDRLRDFLEKQSSYFNRPAFIETDPIFVPHQFSKQQDIEIAGLFAAVFAWGNRKTIIRKSMELMERMDNQPHAFVLNHTESDLKAFLDFKHRTFNATDTLYFLAFLKHHFTHYDTLEILFECQGESTVEKGLVTFHNAFFSLPESPNRTKKHIPTPVRQSTCKRINMYLRWMVRNDRNGVDFGIWKNIRPAQLVCPVDVHSGKVARRLGLLKRKENDWRAAIELTNQLARFDACDPVKYDFALFGISAFNKSELIIDF